MPLVWVGTDENPLWYRPPYRPGDYRIDPNTLRGIEAWRDDHYPQAWLFEEREGPFFGWEVVERFERDGRSWTRIRLPSTDWCLDVEVVPTGLGRLEVVDPGVAYDIALSDDRRRGRRVTTTDPRPGSEVSRKGVSDGR